MVKFGNIVISINDQTLSVDELHFPNTVPVIYNFDERVVVGEGKNIRIEGDKVVCDMEINDNVVISRLERKYPTIGYLYLPKSSRKELLEIGVCDANEDTIIKKRTGKVFSIDEPFVL